MKKLPGNMKRLIKKERDAIFIEMCNEKNSTKWDALNKKYQTYDEMLKPTFKVSWDTVIVAGANILGIVLILKHEKIDIITSKAINFVLKGRV